MRAPLPEELAIALDQARRTLANDPAGALGRGQREMIWRALGQGVAGRRRRVRLGALAVEHVLGDWRRAFPNDDLPTRLLGVAQRVLDGPIEHREAARERVTAWTKMDDLSAPGHLAMIGYAAAQVVAAALYDERFVAPAKTDADADPEDHDASYLVSIECASGPPWDSTSNSERRRAFWTWWLADAVPEAYLDGES